MSGLTSFFREHLPSPSRKTDDESGNSYKKSLQSVERQQPDPQENRFSLVQYSDAPLSYQECKLKRREFLQDFINRRLLVEEEVESNGEEEEDISPTLLPPAFETQQTQDGKTPPSQDSLEAEDGLETQPLETLPFFDSKPADHDDQEKQLIPHVSTTVNNVEYVSDMDLMTARLTLLLCSVTKVWKCRQVKRSHDTLIRRKQPLYSSTPQFPRLAMDYTQEDGPLSPCYKQVLSMEVRQFNTSRLRRQVESSMMTSLSRQGSSNNHCQQQHANNNVKSSRNSSLRVLVFFYKTYAKAIESLLAKCPGECSTVVSLNNVPAKCIFPYPPEDWYDRYDLADCCLAIGDKSLMSVLPAASLSQDHNSKPSQIRFDEEGMIVYVAFCKDCNKGVFSSIYSLTPDIQEGVIIRALHGGSHANENTNPFRDYYASVARDEEEQVSQKRAVTDENSATTANISNVGRQDKSVLKQAPPPPTGTITADLSLERHAPAAASTDLFREQQAPVAAVDKSTNDHIREQQAVTSSITDRTCDQQTATRSVTDRTRDQQAATRSITDRTRDQQTAARGTSDRPRDQQTATRSTADRPRDQQVPSALNPVSQTHSRKRRKTTPPQNQGDIDAETSSDAPRVPAQPAMVPAQPAMVYEKINMLHEIYEHHEAVAVVPGRNEQCIINMHCVVIGFGPPFMTKRGDWMLSVALVDDTCPLAAETGSPVENVHVINVNIFTQSRDKLPKILYAGDVLRMHRVKLQRWNGEMQLMGTRASSYVVFRGDVENPVQTTEWTVIPTAQHSDHPITEEERERVIALWKWGQKRLMSHPSMKLAQKFQLCDLMSCYINQVQQHGDEPASGDITVMVSGIIPVPPHQASGFTPCGFLRVWDGTGPPTSDPYPVPGHVSTSGDPPSSALVKIAYNVKKLQFIRQNPDLQPPKALVGRVANVCIWEPAHWELIHQAVTVGSFVRLRNVAEGNMPDCGLRCLMVRPKTALTPLPNLTYEVIRLLEAHNSLILRNAPHNPQSGILPLHWEGDHAGGPPSPQNVTAPKAPTTPGAESVAASSLADLVAAPVNSTFQGSVHIIGLIPSMSTLSSNGLEQIITTAESPTAINGPTYSYSFGVRLRDAGGSGELDAIIHDDPSSSHSTTTTTATTTSIGHELVGMPAHQARHNSNGALYNLHRLLQERALRHACIRSMAYEGAKFFVVDSLQLGSM